jgi:hypothetical protein
MQRRQYEKTMDRICQHCGELIVGKAYRVTSEEEGITLLDMIVCSLCFMEAKPTFMRRQSMLEAKGFSSKPRESPSATRNLVAWFFRDTGLEYEQVAKGSQKTRDLQTTTKYL